MKVLQKAIFAVGIAVMALTSISQPAIAQYYDDHDYDSDEIGAGEKISGAFVIDGLMGNSNAEDRSSRDRFYYQNNLYNNSFNGRQAVERCIRRAEGWAEKYGAAEVTEIRKVKRTEGGYRVKGNLVVQEDYGDVDYNPGYDKGRFTCFVKVAKIRDIEYYGLDDWD
jgi:hypothetical protein